jgi:hypothetical protein
MPRRAIHSVIHIEAAAPPKPREGQPCNGCGVCCLFDPCPLGVLLSKSRTGACHAVQWDANLGIYRCGALVAPQQVLAAALPTWAKPVARVLARFLPKLARRWIAAGRGCDSSLETIKP